MSKKPKQEKIYIPKSTAELLPFVCIDKGLFYMNDKSSEKKKNKKGCIVSLVMTVLGCLFMGFMLIMAAVSAVNTEGGRQESVTTVQSSNPNTYINTRSTEQIAIVNAAQNEHTSRGGTETRGGDSYIEALTPDQVSRPESSTTSGSSSSQCGKAAKAREVIS